MKTPFTKKYQPKNLRDFHYDEDLTILLKGLMDMDRLNLLLIGNSGSGKTSTLQAIIREYYGPNADIGDNILSINSLQEQGISYYRNEVKMKPWFGKHRFWFYMMSCCGCTGHKVFNTQDPTILNTSTGSGFNRKPDLNIH